MFFYLAVHNAPFASIGMERRKRYCRWNPLHYKTFKETDLFKRMRWVIHFYHPLTRRQLKPYTSKLPLLPLLWDLFFFVVEYRLSAVSLLVERRNREQKWPAYIRALRWFLKGSPSGFYNLTNGDVLGHNAFAYCWWKLVTNYIPKVDTW